MNSRTSIGTRDIGLKDGHFGRLRGVIGLDSREAGMLNDFPSRSLYEKAPITESSHPPWAWL